MVSSSGGEKDSRKREGGSRLKGWFGEVQKQSSQKCLGGLHVVRNPVDWRD